MCVFENALRTQLIALNESDTQKLHLIDSVK